MRDTDKLCISCFVKVAAAGMPAGRIPSSGKLPAQPKLSLFQQARTTPGGATRYNPYTRQMELHTGAPSSYTPKPTPAQPTPTAPAQPTPTAPAQPTPTAPAQPTPAGGSISAGQLYLQEAASKYKSLSPEFQAQSKAREAERVQRTEANRKLDSVVDPIREAGRGGLSSFLHNPFRYSAPYLDPEVQNAYEERRRAGDDSGYGYGAGPGAFSSRGKRNRPPGLLDDARRGYGALISGYDALRNFIPTHNYAAPGKRNMNRRGGAFM